MIIGGVMRMSKKPHEVRYSVNSWDELLDLLNELVVWHSAMGECQVATLQISSHLFNRIGSDRLQKWAEEHFLTIEVQ